MTHEATVKKIAKWVADLRDALVKALLRYHETPRNCPSWTDANECVCTSETT